MDQILHLYGLTLRRNEYLVVWRDPSFGIKNEWNDFLEQRKMFIYKESKMNAFFVGSVEKGLEIIQRKRYNKIILISNIGKDLSGKKFVEVARKILGFDVMVLFFSNNKEHFSWLKKFPNALYTNMNNFYEKYVTNYNKNGLIQLKKEVENEYKIKLKFTDDFLSFPKFADDKQYKDLLFKDINEYFRRVMIQSKQDKKALYMKDGKVQFISYQGNETSDFIWYITIVDNEITLFSNEFYLDADKNKRIVKGFPYMTRWKCEKKIYNYSIYFEDKNNMLTIDGDKALLKNENKNQKNQLFSFIDIQGKKLLN
jgi:predicted secreted protein